MILTKKLVVVDRREKTLHIWKLGAISRRYKCVKAFYVTVGKEGNITPHGLYFIENKTRTPDWRAPDWSEYAGEIIQFTDPRNPFAGGFISLAGSDGVGIHGTRFDPQVGTASSHGCIRMITEEFLSIYDKLPLGTPVYIH